MSYCILPNDREYQILSKRSGISSENETLKNFVGSFREQYGRDPYLDEIPNANSREYLYKELEVSGTSTKYVDMQKVKDFTLEQDITTAQQKLNSIFRDKEIELIPTVEETIIKIKDRPNDNDIKEPLNLDINDPDSTTFFVDGLYKMANQYGIKFKMITDKQIEEQFLDLHITDSKAFIYNGDIYINIDKADVNSPIHEMLHLLVGAMRFTNPQSYTTLLEYVQNLPEFSKYIKQYIGRTINDASEEVLVDQVAQLLTSKNSKIPKELFHDIFYEIQRNLDTLLMGNYSVKTIPMNDMAGMTLLEIGKIVQSERLVNNFSGLLSETYIHRLLNNVKSDLMKSNDLKQICV